MNQNIPSVHVEDTTRHDDLANPLNNLDLFKKINALLDNTLDLSALGLANLTLPQTDANRGAYAPTSEYQGVDNILLIGTHLY